MPQSLVLGNGSLLVSLNERGFVRDVYFPHVGLENHSSEKIHRIGVWVDGSFSWVSDDGWRVTQRYEPRTLVGSTEAVHDGLGIALTSTDIVYNEQSIFLRIIAVRNLRAQTRTVKIFFHQNLCLSESGRADTAYFDPEMNVIMQYKGTRCALFFARQGKQAFSEYAVGMHDPLHGYEGTWRDAEDGSLSGSPIEYGAIDSVIALTLPLAGKASRQCQYWMTMGASIRVARNLHTYVLRKTPEHMVITTRNYWRAWTKQQSIDYSSLSESIVEYFYHVLLVIRTQIDTAGGILASSDSDLLKYGKDSYAYIWPRDGAFTALALDAAGYSDVTQRFYSFCAKTVTDEGYQLHKYLPDGSRASSWLPWVAPDGSRQFPIQEDETAIVIFALWEHWMRHRDLEFIEEMYNTLLKKSADFLVAYRDTEGLPLPSYDVWEEYRGVSTYTTASVYGGLAAAAKFADLLGKKSAARHYSRAAEQVRRQLLSVLWDQARGCFLKQVRVQQNGSLGADHTIDASSVYGIVRFGVLPINDERVQSAIRVVRDTLTVRTSIGGIARFAGDRYCRIPGTTQENPWIITTLWDAQYRIASAHTRDDLKPALAILQWVQRFGSPTGVIPEQLNPFTGEALSVAPLTWSHAAFVETVLQYIEKSKNM